MNVLFATVEMYPLAKIGGLGDVAGSLPKNIRKLGVDIRIVLPYHGTIKVNAKKIGDLNLNSQLYRIYETVVNNVPVYLIKNDFLTRENVYGYEDFLRWARFSMVVTHIPNFLGWDVDVIHGNDWMTSLIPIYSQMYEKNFKFLLTIHNLKHQGEVDKKNLEKLMLPERMKEILVWNEKINYMKGGIETSDAINTVSPTYAREILTEEFGEGLEEILKKNSHKLYGILNGIDYNIWNPEKDRFIYENYSVHDLEGKRKNKEKLKKEMGIDGDLPLIGFVARLVEQKGIDIMAEAIKKIKNAHFVILGTGKEKYEKKIREMKGKNIHPIIKYDETLAHRIYASSDFFLMPSRFEPCGLGQMIAMRYGAIPIVRKTGGLADTVKDINEGGWGFVFEKYESVELLKAIERAIYFYNNGNMDEIVKRSMTQDFSWKKSSEKYVELYRRIL